MTVIAQSLNTRRYSRIALWVTKSILFKVRLSDRYGFVIFSNVYSWTLIWLSTNGKTKTKDSEINIHHFGGNPDPSVLQKYHFTSFLVWRFQAKVSLYFSIFELHILRIQARMIIIYWYINEKKIIFHLSRNSNVELTVCCLKCNFKETTSHF